MGDTDGARGKQKSRAELHEPVAGSGYDASSEPTAAVELDDLEPVDEPSWSDAEQKTQHVYLDQLEEVEGDAEGPVAERWDDQPQHTEAVDLDELEILEKLDPKDANAPPALPEVGERAHVPRAPLPTRRKAAKAKATPAKKKEAARPRSAPPPPPKPPTRRESLEEAPKPMIGGEGWAPEGRISVVDFSAVLSAPPPPRTDEETEKVAVGSPIDAPLSVPPEADETSSGIGKWLLVLLLIAAVGAGAYFLGRQGSGSEPVAEAEAPPSPSREDFDSAWGEDPESESEAGSEAEAEEAETEAGDSEPEESEVEPAATMREPARSEPRGTSPTMRPTMGPGPAEPTSAVEDEPAAAEERTTPMEAEPTMEAASAELPAQPSREEVQIALNAVKRSVAACMEGEHGTVRVRVTVRGSGRVTTAVVQDSLYARPPIGSCIARAVRNATFPPFSNESFVVLYPFQI